MAPLDHLCWQKALFRDRLNRFELVKIRIPELGRRNVIRVSRNHAFEQVTSALPPFLAFCDLQAHIKVSDYDDSLSFPASAAAAEVVWLEYERYERLATLERVVL